MLAHQTSEAEVPGSKPASPTMILMRCRIIVNNVEKKSQGREGNLTLGQKKDLKKTAQQGINTTAMNKTVEIGLFFFFMHILVCSDSNIVLKHILGSEFCKCGEGGGRTGDIFPLTFPPPRLCNVY